MKKFYSSASLLQLLQCVNFCLIHDDCHKCKFGLCECRFSLPSDFIDYVNSPLVNYCDTRTTCKKCPILDKDSDECIWGVIWNDKFLKSFRRF